MRAVRKMSVGVHVYYFIFKHLLFVIQNLCYDGPMEVFNDMIVFPKGVSFQALVKLLEEKKFVKFIILISPVC